MTQDLVDRLRKELEDADRLNGSLIRRFEEIQEAIANFDMELSSPELASEIMRILGHDSKDDR